jgi:DNA polymerase-3 subunit delta
VRLTEEKLSSSIRAGNLERVYFIYGKEPFLISMYADRIIKKTVGEDALDFNLQRLDGNPDPDLLSDYIDTLPVFSEVKVVVIKDFDPEDKVSSNDKRYLEIIGNIPETTILLIYCTNVTIDEKKARTKKFIAAAEKAGAVCSIDLMKAPKIAELCVKKAAKEGVVMSYDDALALTERVGGSMSAASDETAKLMNYAGKGGMITRDSINALVPKQLEAEVFDLADAINAGKRADAYRIIDELFRKQIKPINIMSALSGTFLDMYCAKLAKNGGIGAQAAAQSFGHYGGKAWVFSNKIYPAASRLEIGFLRETVSLLSETDIALKSVRVDSRVLIEEAVTKLFMCRDKRAG